MRDLPYWAHALFWSWVGLFGWSTVAGLIGAYLGRRDAAAVRKRIQERKPEDWLGT